MIGPLSKYLVTSRIHRAQYRRTTGLYLTKSSGETRHVNWRCEVPADNQMLEENEIFLTPLRAFYNTRGSDKFRRTLIESSFPQLVNDRLRTISSQSLI